MDELDGSGCRSTRTHLLYPLLSGLVLALAFTSVVYKAWTLSITIDEAFTYNNWCTGPFSAFFTLSGNNNHPLNTLLCCASVTLFGPGEFTLRLPSVLFSLLYFASMYRMARLLFGASGWLLLTVAVNCANPLVLDHFSTARGYGMGLALWTLGAYYVARWISKPDAEPALIKAGAALGLAVAAHMTEAFAVAALSVSLLTIYLVDRARTQGWAGISSFADRVAWPLVATGLAVGLPILWGPLSLLGPDCIDGTTQFRLGVKTFLDAVLAYRPTFVSSHALMWGPLHKWPWVALLVLFGMLLIAAVVILRRWARAKRLDNLPLVDRQLLVFGTALLVTFLLLRIEPAVLHHPFFGQRRLLFTLPVIFLACPLWLVWLGTLGSWGRAASRAGAVALALLCAHMATQFTPRWFFGWEFDAGTKAIANLLRQTRPASRTELVRVGATSYLSHSLNFYRSLYRMDWIAPVTLNGPTCLYDYYVVLENELAGLSRGEPRVLYRDGVAHTVLAESGPGFRARLTALRQLGFSGQLPCEADLTRREAWAAAGSAGVNGHFLAGVMEDPETSHQRWTFERPAFLFDVSDRTNLKLRLHIRLPDLTFKTTGPVRLTVWINGRRLGEESYRSPEDHIFEKPVPPDWIRTDGMTMVETTLDKYYVAPGDGQKLGYLFVRGGFVN